MVTFKENHFPRFQRGVQHFPGERGSKFFQGGGGGKGGCPIAYFLYKTI